MGLYIAMEDIANQVSYDYGNAQAQITALAAGDSAIGFDDNFPTTIEGFKCFAVTYIQTHTGPTNDRLNVLINNLGLDHSSVFGYTPPPHIIIFAIDDNSSSPLGVHVPYGLSLAPGSPNPFTAHVCLVYNTTPCAGHTVKVAKEGGGTTEATPTEFLYHELAHCFKYVTAADINDHAQATNDENEWCDIAGKNHRDPNDQTVTCDTGTGPWGSCFPASMPILTPDGWIKIGELKAGNPVISYQSATGQTRIRRVTRKLDHAPAEIWELTTQDTEVISTTHSHPFLTRRGWVRACRLRVGDELVTLAGYGRVNSIRKTDRVETVHNLFTAVEHTFIVKGQVVVHNFAYLRALRTWWHRLFVDGKAGVAEHAEQITSIRRQTN